MKILRKLVFSTLLLVPLSSWSADIAVFDNNTYTDSTDEALHLINELNALGHNVTVFSGISAGDWNAALIGANVLVIPELDNGPLAGDLSGAALSAISSYVSNGGGFIGISSNRNDASAHRDITLWNAIFGFSLVHASADEPIDLVAEVGAFVGAPASLLDLSAVEGLDTSSLPAGATSIYTDTAGNTVVSVIPVGAGTMVQVGFDWHSEESGLADWNDVLDRAVGEASGISSFAVEPVPTFGNAGLAILIMLISLFGFVASRRLI